MKVAKSGRVDMYEEAGLRTPSSIYIYISERSVCMCVYVCVSVCVSTYVFSTLTWQYVSWSSRQLRNPIV